MAAELPVPPQDDPGLSPGEMKDFVRRHFEDFVNRQQSDAALRNFSADFLDHDEPGGAVVGPLAAKTMMEHVYRQWPDLRVAIEDILAEGDKVMVRNVWTATNPAGSGKIRFEGFVLWRFARGKIVERWARLSPPVQVDA